MIELQALGVPGKYGPIHQFTHVPSIEDAVAALEHKEGRKPVGSYVLFNAVEPAVATRAASGPARHVPGAGVRGLEGSGVA